MHCGLMDSSTTTTTNNNHEQLQTEILCSACGEPPRVINKNDGVVILPLKRCSRCRQAWYHDLACQKKHFAIHKKECRLVQKSSAAFSTKVRVEARPNLGNCLMANQSIPRHARIIANANNDFWNPLVPPVLLESQRWSRCALCFGTFSENQSFGFGENKNPVYPVLFCSSSCRTMAQTLGLDLEERAVLRLVNERGGGPVKIFSTAILVFRILWAIRQGDQSVIFDQISKLQCQPSTTGGDKDEASHHHSTVVIATVFAMLKVSQDVGLVVPPAKDLEDMLYRIKLNGFSVADGESIAMGIGLYGTPSFMNHSCRPNAIPTFLYGLDHRPPVLYLTACKEIPEGDEIRISYLDNSCPRHLRRERLAKDYFFHCNCQACQDEESNRMTAVQCPHCRSSVQVVPTLAPAPRTLQCLGCQSTDFTKQLEALTAFEKLVEQEEIEAEISTLEQHYKTLKQVCDSSSWYVQESGDRLVHAFLDKLGQATTEAQQEEFASKALIVLEGLLRTSPTTTTTTTTGDDISSSRKFRQAIQWFQAAKLRLFLDPDPSVAIQLLEKAKAFLAPYYPKNHELMRNLEVSLREATM